DGGIPRGEQCRGPDRVRDLRRQRVHFVAKERAVVRIGIEVEIAAGLAQFVFRGTKNLVAVVDERIIAGPYLLNDLHARIAAMRMNADEPSARPKRLDKRRD